MQFIPNAICYQVFGNDDIIFTENMGCTLGDACDATNSGPLILSGRNDSNMDMGKFLHAVICTFVFTANFQENLLIVLTASQ